MPGFKNNLFRGSLELLILKSLSLEPLHGVGIARRIGQITNSTFEVSFGSLFPALHRMEERGWLDAEWTASDQNRRAKYYQLTRAGRKQLGVEVKEWERVVNAVAAALKSV
jgi:PadR family transcriptional regulator, regulatory protein PadR